VTIGQSGKSEGIVKNAKPISLAVVGAGTIVEAVHFPALRRLRDLYRIRTICDLSLERARLAADNMGQEVVATAHVEEVLGDPTIEAVLLATTGSQGRLASLALQAGKHVFAEKPLGLSVAEILAISEASESRRRVLQVGYMKMYDPIVRHAALAISNLEGRKHVRVTVLHPRDDHQLTHLRRHLFNDADQVAIEEADRYEKVRLDEALGEAPAWLRYLYRNVLNGSVVHELSLLRALKLDLPSRFDYAQTWAGSGGEDPPCILAVGKLTPETLLTLSWEWLPSYAEYHEEVAILADSGRVFLEMAPPYILDVRSRLRVERSSGAMRVVTEQFGSYESGFLLQLEAFATAIRDGAAIAASAVGVMADLRCIEALTEAIAREQGITVGGETGERRE